MRQVLVFLSLFSFVSCGAATATFSLADFSNMPLVEAELDGVKATLILDTGASHTTFDTAFVTNAFPKAKLTSVTLLGTTNVRAGTPGPCVFGAKKLKVGDLALDAADAMAFPLGQLSSVVGRKVDGILGMNHLAARPFVLSLADGRIVWDPPAEVCAGFVRAKSRLRGNRRELVARLPNGEELGLLIDSGSTWTFVEDRYWRTTARKTSVASADLNRCANETMRTGEKGLIDCGIRFEIEPMIAPQPGLNQLGAATLKNIDVRFDANGVSLRLRSGKLLSADYSRQFRPCSQSSAADSHIPHLAIADGRSAFKGK